MEATSEVKKPGFVKSKAAGVWRKYAPTLIESGKLTMMTADMFGVWCCLMAEYQAAPQTFHAAKLTQMRLYAKSYSVMPDDEMPESDKSSNDPAEKYFGGKPPKPQLVPKAQVN